MYHSVVLQLPRLLRPALEEGGEHHLRPTAKGSLGGEGGAGEPGEALINDIFYRFKNCFLSDLPVYSVPPWPHPGPSRPPLAPTDGKLLRRRKVSHAVKGQGELQVSKIKKDFPPKKYTTILLNFPYRVFDFSLSPEDMSSISDLNVGWRHLLWAETSMHPDYPFKDWLPAGYKVLELFFCVIFSANGFTFLSLFVRFLNFFCFFPAGPEAGQRLYRRRQIKMVGFFSRKSIHRKNESKNILVHGVCKEHVSVAENKRVHCSISGCRVTIDTQICCLTGISNMFRSFLPAAKPSGPRAV